MLLFDILMLSSFKAVLSPVYIILLIYDFDCLECLQQNRKVAYNYFKINYIHMSQAIVFDRFPFLNYSQLLPSLSQSPYLVSVVILYIVQK